MSLPDNDMADSRVRKPPAEIKVDVVIPVLNEAHVLEWSIATLHRFFEHHVRYDWRLVIAENGSTDDTAQIAERLAARLPRVDFLTIGQPGRGRALRAAWARPGADILCYTDVDLSTELDAFLRVFRALVEEGYDIAVGSRLAPGSRTTRSLKRELVSRVYNGILRWSFGVRFSDAQTGFKALTRQVVDRVLPLVEDDSWFLDTELLVLAERLGFRIADIPIRWTEDDDSRVRILQTAWADLRGVARLRRTLRAGNWPASLSGRRHAGPVLNPAGIGAGVSRDTCSWARALPDEQITQAPKTR